MPVEETFKALSDPVRREILQLLKKQSMNAGEISSHFQITDAAVSRHLSVLKKAGLVRAVRMGKNVRYELCTTVLDEIILWSRSLKGEKEHEEKSVLAENH